FLNKLISRLFKIWISKFFKKFEFIKFFYQKWFNIFQKFQIFGFYHETMNWFMSIFKAWFRGQCASKYSLKPLKIFNLSGIYGHKATEFKTIFYKKFFNVKTSVTIDITSSISKIGFLNHTKIIVD